MPHFHPDGKEPSSFTKALQAERRVSLPFDDERDFEEHKRGFIAAPDLAEPDNLEAKRLLADIFEQIGYQQESPSVRNSFLSAAWEAEIGRPKWSPVWGRLSGISQLRFSSRRPASPTTERSL